MPVQNDSDQSSNSRSAFSVAASPFNAIKLELVIILIFGFLLWMVVDSITESDFTHLIILFLYSTSGAVWLVFRIRNMSQQASSNKTVNE